MSEATDPQEEPSNGTVPDQQLSEPVVPDDDDYPEVTMEPISEQEHRKDAHWVTEMVPSDVRTALPAETDEESYPEPQMEESDEE